MFGTWKKNHTILLRLWLQLPKDTMLKMLIVSRWSCWVDSGFRRSLNDQRQKIIKNHRREGEAIRVIGINQVIVSNDFPIISWWVTRQRVTIEYFGGISRWIIGNNSKEPLIEKGS